MSVIVYAATIFLTIHATHSYILLTATLEDVQAIAKQLAESPVADQFKKVWRRASSQFNQYVEKNKAQKRSKSVEVTNSIEVHGRGDEQVSNDHAFQSEETAAEGRRQTNENLSSWLRKNASFYLSSIKKIMEGV